METGILETEEERYIRRHNQYQKARDQGKSWVNHAKPMIMTDEEREKRRLRSIQYRKDHPNKSKENMRKWRALHGEEEKRSWQEYRRNNKKLAIEYLGGKCMKCNGVFHPDVYDFHHKDSSEKDVCVGRLLSRKFERVTNELDKCILLCANCHRIIHAQY
jgi:predicted HNH restriction endonuclease